MLRRGNENKKPIKEKIILLYDSIFKIDCELKELEDENSNFWEEFFLLKVHPEYIEKKFEAFAGKDISSLKGIFHNVFDKCCSFIQSDQAVRVINAIQTLTCMFRGIFSLELGDHEFDKIDLLIGFDEATTKFPALIRTLTSIILSDQYHTQIKAIVLQLLLVIITGTDNISQNMFVEYVMSDDTLYEAIIELLIDPREKILLGGDLILLLSLLVNYRKYESVNPYIMKLSILDNELALNSLSSVISSSLASFNNQYVSKQEETKSVGLFSAITNMVGNMFVGDADEQKQMIKGNEAILLALYEAIHLNRNFISVLTHSHHHETLIGTPPDTPSGTDDEKSLPATPTPDSEAKIAPTINAICSFLQYTSVVMQDTKVLQNASSSKLCFLILTCITEDQFANSILHDDNMTFHVLIHRMPMRHRKIRPADEKKSAALACWVLDMCVEFIISHMMKDFPFIQHMRCIGIVHRLMCYEKRNNVRLQYQWRDLWSALINLLRYVISNESSLISTWSKGIFALFIQICNLCNMFVTYGDTFLPSPTSYDELYYEIIRMKQVFDNLQALVLRYSINEEFKDIAPRLGSSLVNIRAIIQHFNPKIDKWSKDNNQATLTEEAVLKVIRENYDSLTLKLQDNLDHFERYSERPKETHFFTELVRSIAQSYRKNLVFTNIDLQNFMSLS